MGKKNKRGSKTKKRESKTPKPKKGDKPDLKTPKTLQIDPEILKELTRDLHEVFRFQNGDVYLGHFAITAEGGLVRQGRGKYFAADGVTLTGRWEGDILVEAERISFTDGSWYLGPLEASRYAGPGSYGIPRLGTLNSEFVQGRPLGPSTLTDVDGQIWQGVGVAGSLLLLPRNHFFDSEDAICKATVNDRDKKSSNSLNKNLSLTSKTESSEQNHI